MIIDVLAEARRQGVIITVDGDVLDVCAEAAPKAELLAKLKANKRALLCYLDQFPTFWSSADWSNYFKDCVRDARAAQEDPTEAVADATERCVNEWLNRHPLFGPPDRCARCGEARRGPNDLIPFGDDAGRVWLHAQCWAPWFLERKRAARRALADYGVPVDV